MPRHADFEQQLGHRFANPRLLEQALTHRSFSADHNERLEFLGDGVLTAVMRQTLYAKFPEASEGDLTRLVVSLVRTETLTNLANKLQIEKVMAHGEAAMGSGLESGPTPTMMADTLEAVFGAVFVDAGYDAAQRIILHVYGRIMDTLDPRYIEKDAKTSLNELLQRRRAGVPKYHLLAEVRATRNNQFEIECVVSSMSLTTRGRGPSRQRAEQEAALEMLKKLAK